MDKLTLFKIFRSFTPDEMNSFSEFVETPFYNKASYVTNYFKILRSYYPDFSKGDPKYIFNLLYPQKKYNNATIRRLNSELLFLAEKFLTLTALEKNNTMKSALLLEQLDQRKIDTHFIKKLRSSRSELNSKKKDGEKYYRDNQTLLEIEIIHHTMRERSKGAELFYTAVYNVDVYHAIKKLIGFIVIAQESLNVSEISIDKKKVNEFTKYITDNVYFGLPLIKILYNILQLSIKMEEKYFLELKQLIPEHKDKISEQDLEHGYFMMLNFCVLETNRGSDKYKLEELGIYKDLINEGLLLYNNELESQIFKNIVSCALDVNDLSFARDFMDKFKSHIFTNDKVNIVLYCEANYSYKNRDYETALEILSRLNFSEISYKLSLRVLTLKIYFEKGLYDQSLMAVDAFNHFLKREKKVSLSVKRLYLLFAKFYEHLLKLKLKGDSAGIGVLNKTIKNSDSISKAWLLKQL